MSVATCAPTSCRQLPLGTRTRRTNSFRGIVRPCATRRSARPRSCPRRHDPAGAPVTTTRRTARRPAAEVGFEDYRYFLSPTCADPPGSRMGGGAAPAARALRRRAAACAPRGLLRHGDARRHQRWRTRAHRSASLSPRAAIPPPARKGGWARSRAPRQGSARFPRRVRRGQPRSGRRAAGSYRFGSYQRQAGAPGPRGGPRRRRRSDVGRRGPRPRGCLHDGALTQAARRP